MWGVSQTYLGSEPMLDLGGNPGGVLVPPPAPEGWEAATEEVGWAPAEVTGHPQDEGAGRGAAVPEPKPLERDVLLEPPAPHEPPAVYVEVPEPEFVQATAPEPPVPEPSAYVKPPVPEPSAYVEPPVPEPSASEPPTPQASEAPATDPAAPEAPEAPAPVVYAFQVRHTTRPPPG